MALRLMLQVNDIFYINDVKVCLIDCYNVGNTKVTAILNIYYPNRTKSILLNANQLFEVIESAFIKIWPKGVAAKNLLSIAVQAPAEIYIRREGYTPKTNEARN